MVIQTRVFSHIERAINEREGGRERARASATRRPSTLIPTRAWPACKSTHAYRHQHTPDDLVGLMAA
jgi:hypothetical protein